MHTDAKRYTMKDLVRLTGFSERQIRFYITQKLAPGAGSRGPKVTYGELTLRRLQLVAAFKEKKIQPTGRSLTLDEIRESINALGDEGASTMLGGFGELTIIDTEAKNIGSASDYLDCLRDGAIEYRRSAAIEEPPYPEVCCERTRIDLKTSPADLGDLFFKLRDLLGQLVADDTATSSPAERWVRTSIPDIEIQVRVPDKAARRTRLEAFIRDLDTLLEGENSP